MTDVRNNNFFQIYSGNVDQLYTLNGSEFRLLFAMAKRMSYGHDRYNMVIMTSGTKKAIAKETGMSVKYIGNLMPRLISQGFIVKVSSMDYFITPYIFFRGTVGHRQVAINKWESVKTF